MILIEVKILVVTLRGASRNGVADMVVAMRGFSVARGRVMGSLVPWKRNKEAEA